LSELIPPIVYQVGVGGFLGFIVGYAIKKLTKLIAVLVGVFALLLLYLGYEGVISINYDKLVEVLERLIGLASQTPAIIAPIIASLPFAGSFLIGIALGLKIG